MNKATTKPRTPMRELCVNAADYPILKRQVAKLRADFADYMYSISEPIPKESEPPKEEIDQRKIDQEVERGIEDQAFSEFDSDKAKEWGGIDK